VQLWAILWGAFHHGVLMASKHTGLPAVLVAAMSIVVAWRTAKRALHFAVETALVCAILVFCSIMGWIHF
jgi:hypothetical protein